MTKELDSEMFYLRKNGAYYRPRASGYTFRIEEAGQFSRRYAMADVSATSGEPDIRNRVEMIPVSTPPTPAGAGTETADPLLDAIDGVISKHENAYNQIMYCGVLAHSIRAVVDGYVRRQPDAYTLTILEQEQAMRAFEIQLMNSLHTHSTAHGDIIAACDGLSKRVDVEIPALKKQLATADKDRKRYKNTLGYVIESGDRAGMSRVKQVCQMTLMGEDMMDVMREPSTSLDHGARDANQDKP